MTRELIERIKQEFPITERATVEKFVLGQNSEQPHLKYMGPNFRKPPLKEVQQIAQRTLLRVKTIYQLRDDLETIQGAGKDDIVIIPGYQGRTSHALVVCDMDMDGRKIMFQSSWHANYHMTLKQMDRYISFAQEFFEMFAPDYRRPQRK